MNKKTVLKTCAVVFGALVLLCAVFYAAAYSEYLEYLEIGEKFIKVFATNISVYAISFAAAAVIAFAMILSNLFAVRSNSMHVDTTVRFFENRPFYRCVFRCVCPCVCILLCRWNFRFVSAVYKQRVVQPRRPDFQQRCGVLRFSAPLLYKHY